MHLMSEVSPRDLSYSLQFTEWTETNIKVQFDFNDPLLLSRGGVSDKISIEILQPQLFVSKESGLSLDPDDERQMGSSITIPTQLPKGVIEEVLENQAKYGSAGAVVIGVTQIVG